MPGWATERPALLQIKEKAMMMDQAGEWSTGVQQGCPNPEPQPGAAPLGSPASPMCPASHSGSG